MKYSLYNNKNKNDDEEKQKDEWKALDVLLMQRYIFKYIGQMAMYHLFFKIVFNIILFWWKWKTFYSKFNGYLILQSEKLFICKE